MGSRVTYRQACRLASYQGRWVALDHCRYDQATASPVEGEVVDADDDLAELCARMRSSDRSHCAIVYCAAEPAEAPVSRRVEPRASH